tara:strand:- start:7124 stop:7549 length:426 start_codon:yes stop_codon:yes gene_type:complete
VTDTKFSAKAVAQMLAKKTLSAAHQRKLWARATNAKKLILSLIAPELLELRSRHDALEMLVVVHLAGLLVSQGIDEEAVREALNENRKKALDDLPDNDRLKHLADRHVNELVWKKTEDMMIADIENKQKKPLLDATGIEEG